NCPERHGESRAACTLCARQALSCGSIISLPVRGALVLKSRPEPRHPLPDWKPLEFTALHGTPFPFGARAILRLPWPRRQGNRIIGGLGCERHGPRREPLRNLGRNLRRGPWHPFPIERAIDLAIALPRRSWHSPAGPAAIQSRPANSCH